MKILSTWYVTFVCVFSQMGYVEQPAAPYVQDANGSVVNGMGGVMPVVGGGMAPVAAATAPVAVMTGITRVYVGNLSWETEWQDLKDHMRSAGEVGNIFTFLSASLSSIFLFVHTSLKFFIFLLFIFFVGACTI